jgi:hypothetical protein
MKKLGTILPTAASLAVSDALYEKNQRDNARYAEQHLSHCAVRVVGMETRYYRTPAVYATIAGQQRVRWFETRADGDYAIEAPK